MVAALPVDDDGFRFDLVCAPLAERGRPSAGWTSHQHPITVETPHVDGT